MQSSSCNRTGVCECSPGRTTVPYEFPVAENVFASTPVIFAPSDTGNVDLTFLIEILCMTTDFRSPCFSDVPLTSKKRFCCKMAAVASAVGLHVAFIFRRQRSSREARTDTTIARRTGVSYCTKKIIYKNCKSMHRCK